MSLDPEAIECDYCGAESYGRDWQPAWHTHPGATIDALCCGAHRKHARLDAAADLRALATYKPNPEK